MPQAENDALAILNRRLANGEITSEQYDEMSKRVEHNKISAPSSSHFSRYWWIYAGIFGIIVFANVMQSSLDKGIESGRQECIANGSSPDFCNCIAERAKSGPSPTSEEDGKRMGREYARMCLRR